MIMGSENDDYPRCFVRPSIENRGGPHGGYLWGGSCCCFVCEFSIFMDTVIIQSIKDQNGINLSAVPGRKADSKSREHPGLERGLTDKWWVETEDDTEVGK